MSTRSTSSPEVTAWSVKAGGPQSGRRPRGAWAGGPASGRRTGRGTCDDAVEAFLGLLDELHALGLELAYVAQQSSVARAPGRGSRWRPASELLGDAFLDRRRPRHDEHDRDLPLRACRSSASEPVLHHVEVDVEAERVDVQVGASSRSRTHTHTKPTPLIMIGVLRRGTGPRPVRLAGDVVVLPGQDLVAGTRDRHRHLGGRGPEELGTLGSGKNQCGYLDPAVPRLVGTVESLSAAASYANVGARRSPSSQYGIGASRRSCRPGGRRNA